MADTGAARLAVFGSPIEHSRSPMLHLAAYRVLGLDWRYDRRLVEADQLADVLAGLGDEWRGLSLTMPLKQRAFALANRVDDTARATGSVNTLRLTGESLGGFNTDVAGIVGALRDAGATAARNALVLGAGATAASALAALARMGAEHVTVAARSASRAEPLLAVASRVGLAVTVRELAAGWEGGARVGALGAIDTVISTLPGTATLPHDLPGEVVRSSTLLDVAYDPWPSALATRWLAAGGRAASGLDMLVHQALVQVRIFVGDDPSEPLPDEQAVLAAMFDASRG